MALDPKLYFIHIFVYIDGAQVDGKMKIAGKSGAESSNKRQTSMRRRIGNIFANSRPRLPFFLQSHAAYASKNKKSFAKGTVKV